MAMTAERAVLQQDIPVSSIDGAVATRMYDAGQLSERLATLAISIIHPAAAKPSSSCRQALHPPAEDVQHGLELFLVPRIGLPTESSSRGHTARVGTCPREGWCRSRQASFAAPLVQCAPRTCSPSAAYWQSANAAMHWQDRAAGWVREKGLGQCGG